MLSKTTTTASSISCVVVALAVALLSLAASSAAEHQQQNMEFISPTTLYGENYERLSKQNINPRFFHPESSRLNQQPGYHYKDDVRLSLAATLDDDSKQLLEFLFYQTTKSATSSKDDEAYWDLHMVVDSITRQSESDPINLETDITIEELEMSLKATKSMNVDLDCIGNHIDDHSTISTTITEANQCYGLLDLVGKTETVETDPEGNLVSVKRFDGTTLSPEGLDKIKSTKPQQDFSYPNALNSLNKQFQAQQFAASSHYNKHSEILKWLPDHPVSPGDKWNDHVDMMDSLGAIYTGTSALMGYAECIGHHGQRHDCAVFTMDGILHVDNLSTWFKSLLGGNDEALDQLLEDDHDWLELTGAQITNTIVWNTIDDSPQWIQANISMYMDIRHPSNFNNGKVVSIPINFIMEFGSRIITRPDGDGITVSGSSSTEIVASSSTGIRSILVRLFSFTIIGSFVMAMYVLVKKERRQQQYHQHHHEYYYGSSRQSHHYVLSSDEQEEKNGNTNTATAAAESELPNMI